MPPPLVRPAIVSDLVFAGRLGSPILDVVHFAILREEDSRHWTGNEFHREVASNDPQRLPIVDAAGRLLEHVLESGSFWAVLYDNPGSVGVQGTGTRPALR